MAKATTLAPVEWQISQADAERLMGQGGLEVVDWAIRLAQRLAQENGWPLERITLGRWQDMEFQDWQRLELQLALRAPQRQAEAYWKTYLRALNEHRHIELTESQRETLSKLYYDYAPV